MRKFSLPRARRRTRSRRVRSLRYHWLALAAIALAIFLWQDGRLGSLTLLTIGLPGGSASDEAEASLDLNGRASVIDGDTLDLHGQRIRLHGIDAPESRQTCRDGAGAEYRCGQRAAFALADKIGARPVSCDQRDVDRYGRIVAVCKAGGEDLNAWLVLEGWAVAYRRYSRDYVDEEDEAKAAGRGIWAGDFTVPEEWRRAH